MSVAQTGQALPQWYQSEKSFQDKLQLISLRSPMTTTIFFSRFLTTLLFRCTTTGTNDLLNFFSSLEYMFLSLAAFSAFNNNFGQDQGWYSQNYLRNVSIQVVVVIRVILTKFAFSNFRKVVARRFGEYSEMLH